MPAAANLKVKPVVSELEAVLVSDKLEPTPAAFEVEAGVAMR